jgi:hypothetical protein
VVIVKSPFITVRFVPAGTPVLPAPGVDEVDGADGVGELEAGADGVGELEAGADGAGELEAGADVPATGAGVGMTGTGAGVGMTATGARVGVTATGVFVDDGATAPADPAVAAAVVDALRDVTAKDEALLDHPR